MTATMTPFSIYCHLSHLVRGRYRKQKQAPNRSPVSAIVEAQIGVVDEESDNDIDSRPSEPAKAKRIAPQLGQLEDHNKGPAPANARAIYPSTLDWVYIFGQPLLDTPSACNVSSAPRKHREAMASVQALEWQTSMERELVSMSKHDVYDLLFAQKGC